MGTNKLGTKLADSGLRVPAAQAPRQAGWVIGRAVVGGTGGAVVGYLGNGFSNLVQGEDWNSNWATTVALGFTLGMVPAIPKRSSGRYVGLRESNSIELGATNA